MHLAQRRFRGMSPHNQADLQVVDGRVRPTRKKVCITGGGLYRHLAPLDDPEWEVWCLNLIPNYDRENYLRADRWFDIHQRVAQTEQDLQWIAKCPVPIYLPPDLMDASPNAVRYPLEEIEEAYGSYWACTFAFQIALVLWEGVADTIGLYGVELAFGSARERTVEWANVAYWVGRAEQAGLDVHLPDRSTLGRHRYRYGFEYTAELEAVKAYTNQMLAGLRSEVLRGTDDQVAAPAEPQLQGAVEED